METKDWRKSSYSGSNGGQCVEVGSSHAAAILVRDTTNRDGGTLAFTAGAWRVLLTEIRQR